MILGVEVFACGMLVLTVGVAVVVLGATELELGIAGAATGAAWRIESPTAKATTSVSFVFMGKVLPTKVHSTCHPDPDVVSLSMPS